MFRGRARTRVVPPSWLRHHAERLRQRPSPGHCSEGMRNTPCGVRQRNTTPPKPPEQMGMEPSDVGGSRGFSPLRQPGSGGELGAALAAPCQAALQRPQRKARSAHQKVRSQPPDPNW